MLTRRVQRLRRSLSLAHCNEQCFIADSKAKDKRIFYMQLEYNTLSSKYQSLLLKYEPDSLAERHSYHLSESYGDSDDDASVIKLEPYKRTSRTLRSSK